MNVCKIIIPALLFGLLSTGTAVATAADETGPDYREIIDIIYEWTPYGSSIQVGDIIISRIESVWLDTGGDTISQAGKSHIRQGNLARAVLKKKDRNGFWTAQIIVFSGKGLEKAVKCLSRAKRNEFSELSNP